MAEKPEIRTNPENKRLGRSDQTIAAIETTLRRANIAEISYARLEYAGYRCISFIARCFVHEMETGLGFHLVPVVFGIGIAIYFFAPAEPSIAVLCLVSTATGAIVYRSQSRGAGFYLLSIAFFLLAGMAVAQFSVMRSDNPALQTQITTQIEGTVLNTERNSKGHPRYLIAVADMKTVPPLQWPKRVRLSARTAEKFKPGDTISGLARLQPVSGPVLPGSYDFGFFSRFDKLGGSGFFMGAPERTDTKQQLVQSERLEITVNRFRAVIAGRLETALPGPKGRIVTALVTGDKTGIAEQHKDALRASGLAHILAISGLHMALVTLTVIWVVRLLMVGSKQIATRYPTKKIGAIVGFLVATAYLFVSGGGVATQRAWIMVSVMLLAVLIDRKAITLRSVAISAVIILMLRPQSVFEPGFQMSFAAVTALVVGYEAYYRLHSQRNNSTGSTTGILASIGRFGAGLTLTSLIAGSATLFVSAYHFHQIASFGLLANVLAMPIVSILLMPFILFAMLMMPFGLEAIVLIPVSHALEWILAIATWVSELTPLSNVGSMQPFMAVVFVTGFLTLLLFRTWIRAAGVVVLAMLPVFYDPPNIPDLIVSESGRAAGWKNPSGGFELLFPKQENFVTAIWTKAYAFGTFERANADPTRCNRERCVIEFAHAVAHIVYDPDLLKQSCQQADILIAPRLKWVNCRETTPTLILKRHDFEQRGTHAIRISQPVKGSDGISLEVETSLPPPARPWHRRVPDYGD